MSNTRLLPTAAVADGSVTELFIALELSCKTWVVATHVRSSDNISQYRINGGDVDGLLSLIERLRIRTAGAGGTAVRIACCYEAGRDGFWLHRLLTEQGISNYVIDPASVHVSRRARRAKTDRLDAEALVRVLMAYARGERKVCSMVRVPTADEEDAKRQHRERERLIAARTAHVNRIKGLLATQGVMLTNPVRPDWPELLKKMHTGDGRPIPPRLMAELGRQVRAGQVARADLLLSVAETADARAILSTEEASATQTRLAFRALTGAEPPADLAEPEVLAQFDANHPRLIALRRDVDVSEATNRLLKVQDRDSPEVALLGVVERELANDSYDKRIGIRVVIPFATEGRNEPRRKATEAERTRALVELRTTDSQIRAAVGQAEADLASAKERETFAEERYRAFAERLDLIERSIRVGEGALVELIRARASLFEAEVARLQSQISVMQARSRLNQALGLDPWSSTARTMEIHWSPHSLVNPTEAESQKITLVRRRLRELVPELGNNQIRLTFADEGRSREAADDDAYHHLLLASVQLADGSWLNFSVSTLRLTSTPDHSLLGSLTAIALGIILVSIFLVRSMTAPLRSLATAADRIGIGTASADVPQTGPREVRLAATAFNRMQACIKRLLDDRTQTLAAVSHDLKTPITRLRLRAHFVRYDDLRQTIESDLDEMEAMIQSTLDFLRGDSIGEEIKTIDIGTIIETVCDHLVDSGHDVVLCAETHTPLSCRPRAMKRAFSNLVENAVKYGTRARVSLAKQADRLIVTIDDDGPGIPTAELDRVFDPFYRLEISRSRETGGNGLGLTVARSTIRAHGGDVELANRSGGGLSVIVTLPMSAHLYRPGNTW